MIFFWNRKAKKFNKTYPEIISSLENGELEIIDKLLWQPRNVKIEYLPVVFDMLIKLKRPHASNQNLTIYKTSDKENYQLIIFEVPWFDNDVKYSPVIFDKLSSKIVGIVLPFNELHDFLSSREHSNIAELCKAWISFILST